MNKILEAIEKECRFVNQTIGISGHIRPDGDCFGSTMALYYYLQDAFPQKQIDIYLESVPNSFEFFPLCNMIKTKETMCTASLHIPMTTNVFQQMKNQ